MQSGKGEKASQADPEEIRRFDALAARWWDPHGPMRPLHRMNPLRVGWITDRVRRACGDVRGMRLLDVGCGAGLAAEAFAREGFDVLGIDAAEAALDAARAHAAGRDLPVAYRTALAEELAVEGARFAVITALEVIEHVPEPANFVASLARLLEPGGLLFLSTLNRTPQSFLTAKVAAELLLRWLPVGTHDWRKFVTPAELGAMCRGAGLRIADTSGLTMSPLSGRWLTSRDLSVNYIVQAEAQGT